MRKRELEKLLYKAVAHALGVEIGTEHRKADVSRIEARKARKPEAETGPQQRAA